MISLNKFNHSKKPSIIFFHGLFTNGGFWLSYLKYFKRFKIIVCTIDYSKFVNAPTDLFSLTNNLIEQENIYASISHSFGSFINSSIHQKILKINICPTAISSRTNRTEFISTIMKKKGLHEKHVTDFLEKVDYCVSNNIDFELLSIDNDYNLIPNKDIYFDYLPKPNFVGDHFSIEPGVKKASIYLNESCK